MGAYGPLAGRIWRIGTLAGNAEPACVARALGALADVLGIGARERLPDALRAASQRFAAPARAAARGRLRTRRGASGRGGPATSPRCG